SRSRWEPVFAALYQSWLQFPEVQQLAIRQTARRWSTEPGSGEARTSVQGCAEDLARGSAHDRAVQPTADLVDAQRDPELPADVLRILGRARLRQGLAQQIRLASNRIPPRSG